MKLATSHCAGRFIFFVGTKESDEKLPEKYGFGIEHNLERQL